MVGRVKCGFRLEPKPMDHPPKTERRRFKAARGSVLAAGALAALACSATTDAEVTSRTQTIAGGTADVSHENVFLLVRASEDSAGLCTATLIAPNLLLTARHCVSPGTGDDHVLCGDSLLGEPYPGSAFIATNDAQPRQGSAIFHGIDVRIPGLGEDTCGYDLALIILKENVPDDVSTPAVPRIDREVVPGEPYTAVGYGENEFGSPTHGRMQLSDLSIACQPGSCGEGVESTEFRGETGICSGDSGGPALDADDKVVGVVSRGGPGCSTPVYSTVTAWHDFIVETATEAAKLGGYEAPFWVTTGSSDRPALVGQGGAGGAGGAANELTRASQGEVCDNATACEADLVCFAAGDTTVGKCAPTCQQASDCDDGLACIDAGSVSVCALPTGSADESGGCSVAVAGSRGSLVGVLLAALGTVLGFARRRRSQAD
jgi:V8-like Glu-specific endopeptidase